MQDELKKRSKLLEDLESFLVHLDGTLQNLANENQIKIKDYALEFDGKILRIFLNTQDNRTILHLHKPL